MIILFDRNEKKFDTLGIGVLSDAHSCVVNEALNGEFSLEMEYPINGQHYKDIQLKRIILVKPNPYTQSQPFRIYEITKPINGIINVKGEHISYDLSGYPVKQLDTLEFQNEKNKAQAAMNSLKSNSVLPSIPFNFIAEQTSETELKAVNPTNARNMLAGSSGSILATYGGELIFDRMNITLVKNRGVDRGFHIKYAKNMTDLEQELDGSKLYTGVYPYYFSKETKTVTSKKMTYLGAYIIPNTEPYKKGWLTNIAPSGGKFDEVPTAYLVKDNPIVIKTEEDNVYNDQTYNVKGQIFIYTENNTGSTLSLNYTDNKGKVTTISVSNGEGYFKRVDTEYSKVYIRSEGTKLSKDWFSASADGPMMTPEEGKLYQVWTEGLYYNYIYVWSSKLGESGQYFQVGASTINAYIRNMDVHVAEGVTKGKDTYTNDELLTSTGYKIPSPYDFDKYSILYKIAKGDDTYSSGVYRWSDEQKLFIKTEPDAVRNEKWLAEGSPTQTIKNPSKNLSSTFVIKNTDLENQNGNTYIWIPDRNGEEGTNQYFKVSNGQVWYPRIQLITTDTTEVNNGIYLTEGVIYIGSVDCYILSEADAYSKDWLSLSDGGEALNPEEGVPYRIVTEGSDLKYKTYYWTGSKYVDAGSDECPIVHNIYTMDITSEFDSVPTEDALREKAYEKLKDSDVGEITESTTVSFVKLSDSEEYKNFKDLEKVLIGDIVHVEYEALGVKTLLKVISTEYDVLTNKYNEIEMGTTRATIVNSIVCKNDNISSLTNDKGYTDETTVNEPIAKTITADYIKAQNADFTEAQISQLATGNLRVSGDVNITSGSISIQNEDGSTTFNVTPEGALSANSVDISGRITADSGQIGDCEIDSKGHLKVPSANIEGTITAQVVESTEGNIAGFTIDSDGLYRSTSTGSIYIGEDGIRLGDNLVINTDGTMNVGDKFRVDSEGNVTATDFLKWGNVSKALDYREGGMYLNTSDNKLYVEALDAKYGNVGPVTVSRGDLVFTDCFGEEAFSISESYKYGGRIARNFVRELAIGGPLDSDSVLYKVVFGGYGPLSACGGMQIVKTFNSYRRSARCYSPYEMSKLIVMDDVIQNGINITDFERTKNDGPIRFGFQEISLTASSDTCINTITISNAKYVYCAWAIDKTNWRTTSMALDWSENKINIYSAKVSGDVRTIYLYYICG